MPTAFTFAHDYLGEGVDVVLDNAVEAGLDGVTVAVAYHAARDVFPHNPVRRVAYLESGVTYFEPAATRYGILQPTESNVTRGTALLEDLEAATVARGLRRCAWVVMLHNSRLASVHPDCAPRTVLGDRLLHGLCPAHPEVQRYAVALATDVATRGFDTIAFETLSFSGFDHGHHHERVLFPLGEVSRFLLGLCFCDHCRDRAHHLDVDVDAVAAAVGSHVQASLDSQRGEEAAPADLAAVRSLAGGQVGAYLDTRLLTVADLVQEVVEAVAEVEPSTRCVLLDASGAALGYATGRPATPESAASIAWQDGLDLPRLAQFCDLGVLAYFADAERARREVAAYGDVVGATGQHGLEVVVRPGWPDTDGARDLEAKIDAVQQPFVRDIGFYHYGLMRRESFDWVGQALRARRAIQPKEDT